MRMPNLPQLQGALICLAVAFSGLYACDGGDPVARGRVKAFDTLFDVTLIGVDRRRAGEITGLIEHDLTFMAAEWHPSAQESPVTRINELFNAGSEPFIAPPSVLPLLKLSKDLAQRSEHLFNPAIGHLTRAWGLQNGSLDCRQPPAEDLIQLAVANQPTLDAVSIEDGRLSTDNDTVKLDFRSIQKGFAIDLVAVRLKELGIHNASIRVDDNIYVIGTRHGYPWSVGVRGPAGGGIVATLEVAEQEAVFTTGEYQNNFTWEGETFHDVIDPRTGYPATGTASVTVLHANASTANAAATALFVAGPDQWHRIARQMGLRYVMLTDASGRIHMNPAMQQRVKLQRKNLDIVISEPLT